MSLCLLTCFILSSSVSSTLVLSLLFFTNHMSDIICTSFLQPIASFLTLQSSLRLCFRLLTLLIIRLSLFLIPFNNLLLHSLLFNLVSFCAFVYYALIIKCLSLSLLSIYYLLLHSQLINLVSFCVWHSLSISASVPSLSILPQLYLLSLTRRQFVSSFFVFFFWLFSRYFFHIFCHSEKESS